jgi:hypothetical protein
MKRRGSSAATATTGTLPGLDPACLAAKEKLAAGKVDEGPLPKRRYGRTPEELSIIGFGGMMVKDVTPKDAVNFVAEAVDRGVNYFDVAPYYGNARRRLGPALKPYRQNVSWLARPLSGTPPGRRRNCTSRSGHSRLTTSICTSFTPSWMWRGSSRRSALAVRWRRF